MMNRLHFSLVVLILALLGGCASLPPGSDFPKQKSTALDRPEQTPLGRQFDSAVRKHSGNSGFRIIPVGADGFLVRMQMINAAQSTLDLQYFIFRGDETGRLLTAAVLHAADRGVRVRVLVDDGETIAGDDQISALEAHPSVEIRIFNPFRYRGHSMLLRATEFMFNSARLDYRMHNKLMVVDNAIALIGGRNIGDQYFQMDPESQFADDDVFAAGPITGQLSATFDEYWNSDLAIPTQALSGGMPSHAALHEQREALHEQGRQLQADGADYAKQVASGEPFIGITSGRLPLVWAHAQLVCDSPDKKKVENGVTVGWLMHKAVADVTNAVQSELLMVTPYLIPGHEGMKIFQDLRQRNVRVRILTSSLESSVVLPAQSGYMHYRVPLLESGVELYEVRSLLGNTKGSGETAAISRYGNYALHAKLFVFDRQKLFIGSMNFDQRSMHLNTEIGLIIDSPELAQQIATRFEAMVQPANSYALALRPNETGKPAGLVWRTQESGKAVEYDKEPARSNWQRIKVNMLSLLPLDKEL
ncbi:phospholipase D family protein [Undibacterium sp.]|jgi:putative cardiolipin synthase|uniref:phospholipase D family protein n=1 Tax=Undibacterium sp. TaxID=1914977 RepID=UPI002CF3D2F3|nr:phospholipase D family protein [Undibacterium sp.]HTD04571.1 phospholipase D family protein [Undibacterium sp.]